MDLKVKKRLPLEARMWGLRLWRSAGPPGGRGRADMNAGAAQRGRKIQGRAWAGVHGSNKEKRMLKSLPAGNW